MMPIDWVLIAADATPSGADISQLANYGVLGVFAILLIILARALLKREQAEKDAALAEVKRLNGVIQDKTIPVLEQVVGVMGQVSNQLNEIRQEQELARRLEQRKRGKDDGEQG